MMIDDLDGNSLCVQQMRNMTSDICEFGENAF
jgi:hypothetical protein